jgi:GDP-L-fucose synthase
MEKYDAEDLRVKTSEGAIWDFVNVGTGKELTIKALAEMIRDIVYADVAPRSCALAWDTTKPNGTPRKLCDVSRLAALGWTAKIGLRDGIALAYADYREKSVV